MKKLATLTGVTALAAVLLVGFAVATPPANAGGPKSKIGLARLQAPASGIWLPHHYDNRGGQFDDFVGTPPDTSNASAFNDSAEVEFDGNIGGIGRATVEQSAAWTWSTYNLGIGGGLCAFAYDTSIDLVQIHTHAGVTTDPNDGLGGGVDSDITGSLLLVTADVTNLGTHTFGATVLITDAFGDTIDADVLGGTNCEVDPDFPDGLPN